MAPDEQPEQKTRTVLYAVGLLALVFAVFWSTKALPFWPLEGTADFMQRVTPLFVIALFQERALEVFINVWRGEGEAALATALELATPEKKPELALLAAKYKSETKRIALSAGLTLGIIVSVAGVRALSLFFYPDQIEQLASPQSYVFAAVDMFVTGAVIGGGADGIHKIVNVFTTYLDKTTEGIQKK